MDPSTYTYEETIADVKVVGFVNRGPAVSNPDLTRERDLEDFRGRIAGLGQSETPELAVVDFTNYRMTGGDNGRGVFGLLLMVNRRLKERGGALGVCGHPAQLNPDLQHFHHLGRIFEIYRTRGEALEAFARRRRGEGVMDT